MVYSTSSRICWRPTWWQETEARRRNHSAEFQETAATFEAIRSTERIFQARFWGRESCGNAKKNAEVLSILSDSSPERPRKGSIIWSIITKWRIRQQIWPDLWGLIIIQMMLGSLNNIETQVRVKDVRCFSAVLDVFVFISVSCRRGRGGVWSLSRMLQLDL